MTGLSQISKKLATVFLLAMFAGSFVYASDQVDQQIIEQANPQYFIRLDKATIAKGYTVSAFEDSLKLSLVSGILSEATGVEVMEINENMETPWNLEKLSKIYQFEFRNKAAYDESKPFYIQFSYEKSSNYYKQVFFYDKNYSSWRPLPTRDYPGELMVRSLIHLPFARIAVFSNPEALTIGKASWYKYKGGNFAASPDFPKKSKLRVYNLDNDKFVDVEINDFGPDRKLHPDRAIDLDKVAFSRIASPGAGIINVKIEPLSVVAENNKILGIAETGAKYKPLVTAKSAVAINEKTGEILWQKNATSTLPIASLTKLVAIKVFLDTRPSLNRTISYSTKDEEYNYEYCDKWESARVRLKDGDTLTIEDLLYSSLVGSANNTIETLVRASGLSRNDFIKKMNESVSGWGAGSTKFVEPTGLSPENVSSALDYAIITKEVFTNPIIKKASIMAEYKFSTKNTNEEHRIKNTNKLINTSNLTITGSKTGYLDEALHCLMMRAENNSGEQVIVVLLGAENKDKNFMEAEDLAKYSLSAQAGL